MKELNASIMRVMSDTSSVIRTGRSKPQRHRLGTFRTAVQVEDTCSDEERRRSCDSIYASKTARRAFEKGSTGENASIQAIARPTFSISIVQQSDSDEAVVNAQTYEIK